MGVATSPPDQSSTAVPGAGTAPSTGGGGGTLKYPIDMKDTQDRIKFTVLEINKAQFTANSTNASIQIGSLENPRGYTPKSELGTVFLPVQPSITDQNTVEWGAGELNPIEKYAVNMSLTGMSSLDNMVKAFGQGLERLTKDKKLLGDITGLGQLALVEQAVGVQGLLSRVSGQVLNPNLELLFRGPQLRPFNFSFKLSPRSKKEADIVKAIIKFFKKNMAVRKGGELFLKAPYVFGIEYQHGTEQHKSINKIKECALQSCSVDYTPLNSYMTYDDQADPEAPMVSYTISMQFQEIVPIYDTDYTEHPIGY